MNDLIYLEDGKVKVSESAMQIQEFKDFKRYDRSANGVFFQKAMNYIFFVYKVFGSNKENKSYLSNLPLSQRKIIATKTHCQPYSLSDMEESKYVKACVEAYLLYSRTQSERLLDALKEDLNRYIEYVETIPLEIKKTVNVEVNYNDSEGNRRTDIVPVEVEIPNVEVRLKGVKDVQTYREMYSKLEQQADRDQKIKQTQSRLFEDPNATKMIHLEGFPVAEK
jgi:ASC-1-like (ASCH) protein